MKDLPFRCLGCVAMTQHEIEELDDGTLLGHCKECGTTRELPPPWN